jgi:two-component system cell cycle response regulator
MSSPPHRTLRVIVVEDDDGDAVLVERALARSEFVPVRAISRQAALERLAESAFDAALLDLSLSDSFGLDGLDVIRAKFPDLPIVVVTGLTDSDLALEALQRGAQDYLVKCDWTPSLLVRTLRYAILRQQLLAENRRLMSELARLARHDALTGLLNRRSLLEELGREWSRVCRSGENLACVLLDVDFFKKVNDAHGHAAGDAVLRAVAEMLQSGCRTSDIAGRYGGEEFCVVLPAASEEAALAWAERMRKRIAQMSISVGAEQVRITASFGVAERRSPMATMEAVIEHADQALRLAKQLGRDRVLPFGKIARSDASSQRAANDAMTRVTAADLLNPISASLLPTVTLQEAALHLLGVRVDCVPIVDSDGYLVGTVSEAELAWGVATHPGWKRSVAEVMIRRPACFSSWVDAAVIREFLSRTGARHVLIVEGRRPIGTVSQLSILRWLAWQSEDAGESGAAAFAPAADPAITAIQAVPV